MAGNQTPTKSPRSTTPASPPPSPRLPKRDISPIYTGPLTRARLRALPSVNNIIAERAAQGNKATPTRLQHVSPPVSPPGSPTPETNTQPPVIIQNIPERFLDFGYQLKSRTKARFADLDFSGDTRPAEFPFMAHVTYVGFNWCGGILIDTRTVLTAAHCAQDMPAHLLNVTLGQYNISQTEGREQMIMVKEKRMHPEADAALLILDSPAELNVNVNIVPSLATCLPPLGYPAIAVGWGVTKHGTRNRSPNTPAEVLQKVIVPLQHRSKCVQEGNLMPRFRVCAGSSIPYMNVCGGDSGGPLLVREGSSDEWSLLGITAEGPLDCPADKRYANFVAIPLIREWILKNKFLTYYTCGAMSFVYQSQEYVILMSIAFISFFLVA